MVCYNILRHRETTTTSLSVKQWKPHRDPACETCVRLHKGGRRPKKSRSGRPKEQEELVLSRELLNIIIEKTQADVIPSDMSLSQFENPHNPHNPCICHICKKILRRLVTLGELLAYILLELHYSINRGQDTERKRSYEYGPEIRYEDLIPSKYVTSILSILSIECKENCGMYLPVNKLDAKREHETTCNNHPNLSTSITFNEL